MSQLNGATSSGQWREPALAVQCGCTALVTTYCHGRGFALHFGADHTTAAIWPLIADGFLSAALPQ